MTINTTEIEEIIVIYGELCNLHYINSNMLRASIYIMLIIEYDYLYINKLNDKQLSCLKVTLKKR